MDDIYSSVKYSELRKIYAERLGYIGINNPVIPRKKKDLVIMLQMADIAGVPKDKDTKFEDSVREAAIKILKPAKYEKREASQPIMIS